MGCVVGYDVDVVLEADVGDLVVADVDLVAGVVVVVVGVVVELVVELERCVGFVAQPRL